MTKVDTLDTLCYGIFETARYPVTFFKRLVRAVLTFAIPVAFATTFPAQALLGTVDLRLLIAGIALATVALILAARVGPVHWIVQEGDDVSGPALCAAASQRVFSHRPVYAVVLSKGRTPYPLE